MSATVASFDYATKQIAIYVNLFNLIIGIPGGILNIIVFLSLKTFRENTCSFYLIIVSFVNIGQLLTGSLTRCLISGYGIDWTLTSRFYCKFRIYLGQTFSLITLTCLFLATVDQYFATCSRPRWQQWSNIKLVRYFSAITIIFWSIFAILFAVYYDIVVSTSTHKITSLFALLAHRNMKHLAYRTVPLVRRELDKQLTRMLLVQVIVNACALLCFNVVSIVVPDIMTSTDLVILAKVRFVQILSYSLYYIYPACPFYIYVCVSERFRRQLVYVLFVKYFNHCPKLRFRTNEVEPQI